MTNRSLRYFWCAVQVLLSSTGHVHANSAQTYFDGTMGSLPFLSKYVDITRERITIVPDSGFRSAHFHIEYDVRSDREGMRIPMVFYALEYATGFRVLFDGVELSVRSTPSQAVLSDTTLAEVAGSFHVITWNANGKEVVPNVDLRFKTTDLLFFTADFTTGTHTIVFEYEAMPWRDMATWTETRELRYALSPAQTWKSFGSLEIELDLSRAGEGDVTTNLGDPLAISTPERWMWSFSALPADEIRVERRHRPNAFARALLFLEPEGLAFIALALMGLWHARAIRRFRSKKPSGLSRVLVVGGLLIPLLAVLANVYAYALIASAIGRQVSPQHGSYSFLAIFLYPFIMPVYFGAMWGWDLWCKRRTPQATLTAP
jgi:hypothetical protein